jgi:hypothetical protein
MNFGRCRIPASACRMGLGIEAAARQYQLEFVPLVDERFDLLVWRKAYFDPPFNGCLRFAAPLPLPIVQECWGDTTCGVSAKCASTVASAAASEAAAEVRARRARGKKKHTGRFRDGPVKKLKISD